MNIKENNQHHLNFGLEQPCFLGSWSGCTLPFKALPFGEWIVLEDPRLITGNNSTQHIWCNFKLFQDVLTHLHTIFLLPIIQQPTYHFRTNLPHPQIFCDDPSHPLTIHVQLICYYSNCKAAVTAHFFSHTLNIFVGSAYCWPSTPRIIFHILSSL